MSVIPRREPAIVFLAVLAVGLVLAVAGLAGHAGRSAGDAGRSAGETLAPGAGGAGLAGVLADGSGTAAVDAAVEERHPLREEAVAALAAFRYLVFGDATGAAVVGRGGWLYTLEEFERHETDADYLASRLGEIGRVRSELAARGVSLAVVLVPSKARVNPQPLAPRWRKLSMHRRYALARRALDEEGIIAPDLTSVLRPHAFFARDTHWTPEGARAVAVALAAGVRLAGALDGVTRIAYEYEAAGVAPVPGDLMAFLPVDGLRDVLGLPEEQAVLYETTAPPSGGGMGLFDDLTIPVALVGTSYSRDERWGFEASLRVALGVDVLNVATEGAGPFEPMREFLAGTVIEDVAPSLVVWEIPERYLTLPWGPGE